MPYPKMSRRDLLKTAGAAGLSLAASGKVLARARKAEETIRVGILFSLTGVTAIPGTNLKDATLLAIEEINKASGVLGKKVEARIEDPQSRFTDVYPDRAKKLLMEDKVSAVFGCWTSVSRKFVKPVIEENNGLLFYPAEYEGNESSKNIIYTGPTPNQQILPAIDWFLSKEGGAKKKFYLVGSDYIYPRTINFLIASHLKAKKLEPVAEQYTPLGHQDYADLAKAIAKAGPDVIINSIIGDSNINFYKELAANGIKPEKCPVVATSIDEDDLKSLPRETVTGHLAAHCYFQSLKTKANQDFVARFQKKYGKDSVTTANIEAAYLQVFLWKAAVEKTKSTDVAKVQEAIRGLEFDAPEGKVKVDEKNNHTWKKFRLGKINKDRQFDLVFESKEWIKPDPYRSPLKFGN